MIALVFPELQDVGRIVAACLNIAEEEALFHLFEGSQLVAGTAGFRIYRAHGQHAANLEVRIDLVAFDNGFGRSEEFMVCDLEQGSVFVLVFAIEDAAVGEGGKGYVDFALIVDLVEGHPEFYIVFVTLEAGYGEADEKNKMMSSRTGFGIY